MALSKEDLAALQTTIEALKQSGSDLQETLDSGLKALVAQGKQLNANDEIAQRIALALVKGKDATEATNEAMSASLDVRLLGADLEERALIAAESQRDALVAIRQNLEDKNSEQAKSLDNLIKQADTQVEINKKASDHADQIERMVKLQPKAGAMYAGTIPGGSTARRVTRGVVQSVKTAVRPAAKVGETAAKTGKGGKKALVAGATAALAYEGMTYAVDKTIDTVQDWIKTANDANKAVNAQQTALARAMGQVSSMDMAVRKSIPGMVSLSERIIQLQREYQHLGVTQADVGTAMMGMAQNSRTMGTAMGRLSGRSAHIANGLTELAMKFKTVGIETSTYGSMVDILGKTYRVSDVVGHSEKLGAEIVNLAAATGQMTNIVAQQFTTAMEQLSVYSLPKAKEIFKQLSVTVAETGVEMSTLMSVAGQFDSIDSAAESAGQLNAMLGGPYLNTLDLVNAEEHERIAMIKRAVEASGRSFQDMGKFEKLAIAQTLNVKNMAEAQALFGGGQDVIEAKTAAMEKNTISAENMFKATGDVAKNATEFGQQFAAARESAMLVGGAFDHIEKGARAVNNTMYQIGESAEGYIRKYVVGMARDTTKAYKVAEAHAKKGDFGQALLAQSTAPLRVLAGIAEQVAADVSGQPTPTATVSGTGAESARATPTFQQIKANIPVEGRAEPTHAAALKDIVSILGGKGGLKASIENVLVLDGKVIQREINKNVDLHMKEVTAGL